MVIKPVRLTFLWTRRCAKFSSIAIILTLLTMSVGLIEVARRVPLQGIFRKNLILIYNHDVISILSLLFPHESLWWKPHEGYFLRSGSLWSPYCNSIDFKVYTFWPVATLLGKQSIIFRYKTTLPTGHDTRLQSKSSLRRAVNSYSSQF